MAMDPLKIIKKYYRPGTKAYKSLVNHGRLVSKKAAEIAKKAKKKNPKLKIDMQFLKEAAMLHDIGIIRVHAPDIGCHGKHPYIMHSIIGSRILKKEGLPRHAKVCETHIGVGLTKADIRKQKLPLPKISMVPKTAEEKIICLADLFYSKRPDVKDRELSIEFIEMMISRFGRHKVRKMRRMFKEFGYP